VKVLAPHIELTPAAVLAELAKKESVCVTSGVERAEVDILGTVPSLIVLPFA
jgi:hypothetical protein